MEIRDYVLQAKREPSREHLEELWRAVFMLKAWYFVPAAEDEGPTRPMVTVLEGDCWIPTFTDVRNYRGFVDHSEQLASGRELHALLLDPGESLQRILQVREAVDGVVFNPGSAFEFRAPVGALEEYAEHFDVPVGGGGEYREPNES